MFYNISVISSSHIISFLILTVTKLAYVIASLYFRTIIIPNIVEFRNIQHLKDSLEHGDLKEVARLSGYSYTTVYKFLSQEKGHRISNKAIMKIVEDAKKIALDNLSIEKDTEVLFIG